MAHSGHARGGIGGSFREFQRLPVGVFPYDTSWRMAVLGRYPVHLPQRAPAESPLPEDGVLYQEIRMPQWLKYFLLLLVLLLIASVALGWWKYAVR